MDFYSGEKHEMSISEEGHLLPPSIAQKKKMEPLGSPSTVGYYRFLDSKFYFRKKPCWFHRMMTKILLGWEWKDEI
jgi:hypothetical protein